MIKHAKLFSLLNLMGINPKMKDLKERIKIQKIVYLLKSGGFIDDFRFNWYIYGPYSPDLTTTIYEVIRNPSDIVYTYNDLPKNEIRKFKKLIFAGEKTPYDLELLASLQFLKDQARERKIDPATVKKKLVEGLITLKPKYNENQVNDAWNKLERIFS